jgi:hypothetical protein
MEYLVQITGGGKFASAEDVQDLVADIVSLPILVPQHGS